MLLNHFYSWMEGVRRADLLAGRNNRLTRLSLDMLLPGPTALPQVELVINDAEDGSDVS